MNSILLIDKITDNSIILYSKELTPRQYSKLKMFLDSISDIESVEKEQNIIIVFNSEIESLYFGEIITKIINYLNKQSIEFELSNFIENLKEKHDEKKSKIGLKTQLLEHIKKSDINKSEEFLEFKNFCDSNLKIKLKDYQYKSAYILSLAKFGFEFSVPGAGKTIISYAAYNYYRYYDNIEYLLIIGPKNAYNAWVEEYYTCFGKNPDFYNISDLNLSQAKDYLSASENNHCEISFINVEKIRNLTKQINNFLKNKKCLIIIDEGHKIKNPNASSTKSALEISKNSEYKILLTGTPMPNGYEDLFSLTQFISTNFQIIPFTYNQLKSFTANGIPEAQEKTIMDSLFPFFSRISKKDLIESGEIKVPKFQLSYTEMCEEQRIIYDFLDGIMIDLLNKWENEYLFILMKAVLIRKMQISANPKLLNKSLLDSFDDLRNEYFNLENDLDTIDEETYQANKIKIELIDKMINNEISKSNIGLILRKFNNDKIIIPKNQLAVNLVEEIIMIDKKVILWDVFVENMNTLKKMIESQLNIEVGIVNGKVTGDDRDKTLKNFREGDLKVLIASPATLAESISLHKCCQNAIYVNRNYNAAQFIQSKDRIHRINMPDDTTAHYKYLLNKDSVDEAVMERLEIKENRMIKILDSCNLTIGDIESKDYFGITNEDVINSYKK